MSNYKIFQAYKTELKTLSNVVNKFDFAKLVKDLEKGNAKGNFSIFAKDGVLSKNTRYAFLCFAIKHVYLRGSLIDDKKVSDQKLASFIQVLFEMSAQKDIKIRTGWDKANKKATTKDGVQLSFTDLLTLWEKASVKKADDIATGTPKETETVTV